MVMGMNETLYGDVLFLVNFSMDYLTLFLTAKLLHRKIKPLRLCFASVLGGIYGVAACFMGGFVLWKLMLDIAVSVLICYISFSEKVLSCCAVFYTVGLMLGGTVTALLYVVGTVGGTRTVYVDGSYRTLQADIPLGWMAVIAVLAGIAAIAGGRIWGRARHTGEVTLAVTMLNRTTFLRGIIDSGNMLTEVISGSPVIVVTSGAMEKILGATEGFEVSEYLKCDPCRVSEALPPELAPRLRLIPAATANGEGLLLGFRCDSVKIEGVSRAAIGALGQGESYGGSEALVPSLLL